MKEILIIAAFIALIAAFVLLFANKLGFIEWLQINGNRFFSEMARCNFCLSFWVGLVLSILFVVYTGNMNILFVPVISTPLTRFLI